ncbi:MAG: (d)CMP kinase [Methermicoccaceae archaeon]
MRVAIGGLPGSGTTTLSEIVAKALGTEVYSSGELFRSLAKEMDMELSEFGKLCESDESIDKELDKRMQEVSKRSNGVFDGRLVGYFAEAELKVWLQASDEVRAKRIAKREGIPMEKALKQMIEREKSERVRYLSYYGIDISDTSPYDMVLSSEKFDPDGLKNIIMVALENLKLTD